MDKILVTGGTGLVGNALQKVLPDAIYVGSNDCSLTNPFDVEELFDKKRPHAVIHLAARVGGVKANTNYMADFFLENMLINLNVLDAAYRYNAKVVSLLSTCVYPDKVIYPLTENQLHNGPPHESNYGYAYAKRMLEIQSRAYRQQFGCNFITLIPNNLFGPHDNFDYDNSHVIPALIRKIWEAKQGERDVVLWGSGKPLREFTYSKDLANIILWALYNYDGDKPLNVGCTMEYPIRDVAEQIAKYLEFDGEIHWDIEQPEGQFKKPSSNQEFLKLTKFEYSDFTESLKETCEWFKENYPNIRG